MIRLFQIVVLGCVGFLLTGCNPPEKSDALWKNIKISDLAPSHPGSQPLKIINFNVHIFETPDANISELDDVWEMLYAGPLRFNDYDAFIANSFSVGFGQIQMWNKIGDSLRAANSRKAGTISLLLVDGHANDITVVRIHDKQTIFYISTDGSMEGATVGPVELVLRIKAEKIPGSKGVCNVDTMPVFSPLKRSSIPELAARAKSGEFLFTSVGFRTKMSPGDFVLLGSKKYISSQTTLGGLFFSNPRGGLFFSKSKGSQVLKAERKPFVRIFLLVCTGIKD